MMTLMGIAAQGRDITLNGLKASVVKHMAADPRRVARIEVDLELDGSGLGECERAVLEHAARTCPVAKSLHPDLVQEVRFHYT
jgi:uncharacterized OsmC-like protein